MPRIAGSSGECRAVVSVPVIVRMSALSCWQLVNACWQLNAKLEKCQKNKETGSLERKGIWIASLWRVL